MASIGTEAVAMKEPKPKASGNIHIPKGTIDVKGFKDVSVNENVTIILKGRLSELRDKADEWDPGKNISMEVSSCEIKGPGKKVSMSDAIKASSKKV